MRTGAANVVVVGAGRLGRQVAARLAARGDLAAVADVDPAARAEVRAAGQLTLADASAALVDDHVEAVVLCVPVSARPALVEAALGEGRHVLVPVPFAADDAAAQALVARAAERGCLLWPLDPVGEAPAVVALTARLADLGSPRRAHLQRSRPPGVADAGDLVGPAGLAAGDLALLLRALEVEPGAPLVSPGVDRVSARLDALGGVVTLEGTGGRATLVVDRADAEAGTRLTVSGPRGGLVLEARGLFATPAHGARRRIEVEPAEGAAGAGGEGGWGGGLAQCLDAFLAALEGTDRPRAPALDRLLAAQRVAAVAAGAGQAGGARLDLPADVFVHPTAQVDGPVEVGAGTRIWHFSKLIGPLRIGRGCTLGQNVVVERGVTLGHNVKVQNNVSIYSGVVLEDDVFCGPSMVFTNVGIPRSHHPRRGEYLETRVGRGATIGANATIVCGHTLGQYSFVGAGAVVTRDVPDFALVFGNPARVRGYACVCGVRLDLEVPADAGADEGSTRATCSACGRRYTRAGHLVRLEPQGEQQ